MNAPIQAMQYPDFPYPKGTKSYPSNHEVWEYMKLYANEFNITDKIKLHHVVEHVSPVDKEDMKTKWRISVRDVPNKRLKHRIFDSVFVCSGAYTQPNIPQIEGEFEGRIIHSRKYRKAEDFRGLLIFFGSSLRVMKTIKKMMQ